MGRLIDGVWVSHDLGADDQGHYVRRAAKFRNVITADGDSGFAGEPGRYHLYVAHACGWSHRTIILRRLRRLENVITASYVEPFMGDQGWTFADGADPLFGMSKLYEVYLEGQSDYTGRASVPVLWDRKTGSIVTNESKDIVRSIDQGFGELADSSALLFPDDRADAIEAMIEANYEAINNGVYKCGFAASQKAHESASRALFARLDELEALLGRQRYLVGDEITAADWYLFPTLFRFDTVYYIHFKCCLRQLRDYPKLWAYTRELYRVPGIAETCNLDEIRRHYYTSHESIHPRRYIPIGPNIDF